MTPLAPCPHDVAHDVPKQIPNPQDHLTTTTPLPRWALFSSPIVWQRLALLPLPLLLAAAVVIQPKFPLCAIPKKTPIPPPPTQVPTVLSQFHLLSLSLFPPSLHPSSSPSHLLQRHVNNVHSCLRKGPGRQDWRDQRAHLHPTQGRGLRLLWHCLPN